MHFDSFIIWAAILVALSLGHSCARPATHRSTHDELTSQLHHHRHAIDDNGAGPRHRGLLGRKAGTQPDFEYSTSLRASGLVWTAAKLDQWLANPNALVPGNKMVVQLANDPADRAAIIAFLRSATK